MPNDLETDMSRINPRAIDGRGMDDRKRLAAELMVSGLSKKEVAEKVGIDESTLWRWQRQEGFAAFLDQLRADALQEMHDQVRMVARLSLRAVGDAVIEGDPEIALKYLGLARAGQIPIAPDQTTGGGRGEPGQLPKGREQLET